MKKPKRKCGCEPAASDVVALAVIAALLLPYGFTSSQAIAQARCLLARAYNALAHELRPAKSRSLFGK